MKYDDAAFKAELKRRVLNDRLRYVRNFLTGVALVLWGYIFTKLLTQFHV